MGEDVGMRYMSCFVSHTPLNHCYKSNMDLARSQLFECDKQYRRLTLERWLLRLDGYLRNLSNAFYYKIPFFESHAQIRLFHKLGSTNYKIRFLFIFQIFFKNCAFTCTVVFTETDIVQI